MDDDPEYHRVYCLRDEAGREFSDMFEVHIVELGKKLHGDRQLDDWIRLFNAKCEEELNMIQAKTTNPGILAAIREVRIMSLGKTLRALYEGHMKEIRDRNAREEYVYDEGVAAGKTVGKTEGKAEDILQLLAEVGDIPIDLEQKIRAERNMDILNEWLKCAARAQSIEEFLRFGGQAGQPLLK